MGILTVIIMRRQAGEGYGIWWKAGDSGRPLGQALFDRIPARINHVCSSNTASIKQRQTTKNQHGNSK